MRDAPERLRFEIAAREGAARTGRLLTAHGPISTPAFIEVLHAATAPGVLGE